MRGLQNSHMSLAFCKFYPIFNAYTLYLYREGKKNNQKSIRICQRLFICQTLWGPKSQSIHVYVKKILSTLLHPFGTFFTLFLICGVLKKGHFPTSEVKNDDNSEFFEKNYPRFFVQGIYGRCGFWT